MYLVPQSSGFIIWLTGMRKAGKSTLAAQLTQRLALAGKQVQLLDEGGEAKFLIETLGTSKEDHAAVVKRFGYVAKAIAKAGGVAICAALSPYRDAREALRKEARRFVEVFVDAPMETLLHRDGKEALYKRALASEIRGVAGVDLPYEPPAHPELVLRTDQDPVETCLLKVLQTLVDGKYLTPAEFGTLSGGQKPKRRSAKAAKAAATAAPASKAKPAGKAAPKAAAKPASKVAASKAGARQGPKKAAARTARR
jgi:adenylyl-sulfate kinase